MNEAVIAWTFKQGGQFAAATGIVSVTFLLVWRHFKELLAQTRAPVEHWERLNEARVEEIKELRAEIISLREEMLRLYQRISHLERENADLAQRLKKYENGSGK